MNVIYFKDTWAWKRKMALDDSSLRGVLDCASLPTQLSAAQAISALELCNECSEIKKFALHQIESGVLCKNSVIYTVRINVSVSEASANIIVLTLYFYDWGDEAYLTTIEMPKEDFLN